MECNKDEAAKAKELAQNRFIQKDLIAAKKLALKAQNLFPALEGLQQLLTTLDIHISFERKINGEIDWYGILGVDSSTDDETVKKQYRKLALALHPDKNKSIGADGAFKILSDAWSLLGDKARRKAYDQKISTRGIYQKVQLDKHSNSVSRNGFHPSANVTNTNIRSQKSVAEPHSGPPRPQQPRSDTFWTVCNGCKMQFEYLKTYRNQRLLCYNCREPFVAVEMPPPQTYGRQPLPSHLHHHASIHSKAGFNSTGRGTVASASNGGQSGLPGGLGSKGASASFAAQSTNGLQIPDKTKRNHEEREVNATDEPNNQFPIIKGERSRKRRHSNQPQPNDTNMESQIEIRNVLMAKAKMEICKKLEEWKNNAAMMKVSDKVVEGEKQEKVRKSVIEKRPRAGEGDKAASFNVKRDGSNRKIKTALKESSGVDSDTQVPESTVVSMSVPDPDFYDFDKDRSENSFGDNQVWAAYDDDDGMPRYYAMIHCVISKKPFKMRISWLNSKSNAEFGPINWVGSGFPKTSGEFRVGKYEINKSVNSFSHKVAWTKGTRGVIQIYPRKGDIWALYLNWSPEWNELTPDETVHQYDMVEVLDDYNEEKGLTVISLVKVPNFKTVFRQNLSLKQPKLIPKEEMFRFSHQVPSYLLTGQESNDALKGCRELDPAATPLELLQVISDQTENALEVKD